MTEEILKEIKTRVDVENRSPMELYMLVLTAATSMMRTREMTRDELVVMCSSLISLYEKLQNEVK